LFVAIVAGAAVLFTGIDPRRRHGGWGWIVHGRSWCRWSSVACGDVTVLGCVGRAPPVALWMDPKVYAAQVARFRSKIVARPGDGDCSIW